MRQCPLLALSYFNTHPRKGQLVGMQANIDAYVSIRLPRGGGQNQLDKGNNGLFQFTPLRGGGVLSFP